IQLLAKLRLVESEPLKAYLDGVIDALAAQTPAHERDAFRAFLLTARETETSMAAQAQVLHRPLAPGAPPAGGAPAQPIPAHASAGMALSMRQFTLLLSRLGLTDERAVGPAGSPPPGGADRHAVADRQRAALIEQAPQLLVVAAQSARNQ